jgi:hypothetical protein
MRRRLGPVLAVLTVTFALPPAVSAHALVGRVVTPLPLVVYLAGAAMAVALSFGFVIFRDVRAEPAPRGEPRVVPRWFVLGLRGLGLLAWLWIVAQLIVGGSSLADVATLFLWVYGWVGVAMLCAIVGPVWSWLDPFTTLHDIGAAIIRRLGVTPWQPSPYPRWLAQWPAVIGLTTFVWLELVYLGGSLGAILVAYTIFTLIAMAQFGRDAWRTNGETFSVWFGTLGRLARYASDSPGSRVVRKRPWFSGLLEGTWTVPLVVLVAVGTGSILFDGLSQTAPWYDVFGIPGLGIATLQLLGFLGLVAGGALWIGRMVGIQAVGAGLLPIAAGYLVAHYLTYLLGDGQLIIVALSDPFQLGWDLFGTAFYEPSTDWIPPALVWTIQLAVVIGGHVVGAWAGHVVAVANAGRDITSAQIRWRQVPLAILMVALTATTLWSLGQAIVEDPQASATAVAGERSD